MGVCYFIHLTMLVFLIHSTTLVFFHLKVVTCFSLILPYYKHVVFSTSIKGLCGDGFKLVCVVIWVVMAKQKTLNGMFSHINKEDMEMTIKCDFVALNVKLELEHSTKKEVVKRPMRWPKKQIEVVLLAPKVEKHEDGSTSKKICAFSLGNYLCSNETT